MIFSYTGARCIETSVFFISGAVNKKAKISTCVRLFSITSIIKTVNKKHFKEITRAKILNHTVYHQKSVNLRFHSDNCQETMKVLNVAEKNDAAKNLAEIMSGGRYRRRDGFSKYNKIYDFDCRLLNNWCSMVMTSVSGHLLNLDFVGAYRKWTTCNPLALFDAPISKECPKDYQDIKRTLEREVCKCDVLVIWTDCDREGENIGFEIIEVCKAVKPSIRVYRARFSEITQAAVSRACQNLGPPDQRQSDAVYVRRELDLRIGAAFTRFQTLRLKRVFPEVLSEQLISYGSCQFPTLGFVVERYKEMQNFVPEPFWKIKVMHKKDGLSAEFGWDRNRLFDHTACLAIYQLCLESPLAKVIDIKSRNKSKWRPVPLETVELEKLGSRKLRLSAKETMRIAEKLYTQGLISYPRTETNIFPKEIDLSRLVQLQMVDPNWGTFAANIMEQGATPRQGTKTDNAHPPIHPLKYSDSLQGNEKQVYEFVVRHFLACVSKDAQGMETTVQIEIADEKFGLSGLIILERNYLDVYPYDKWNTKTIPAYLLSETFQPTAIEMADGETSAPLLLTEADLISLMDKHGIGTDATHADHIETIKARLYVGLTDDKRFVPGELGMGLVEGYDLMGFEMSKPNLRAELEADLKRICEGVREPEVVLREQLTKYKDVFVKSVEQANKIDEALAQYFGQAQQLAGNVLQETVFHPVMRCPKCRASDVIVRRKKDETGWYLCCLGFPQCRAAIWLPSLVESVEVTDELCQQCKPGPVHLLRFKFKYRSMAPYFQDTHVGCLGGCDQFLLDKLDARPLLPTPLTDISNFGQIRNNIRDSGYHSDASAHQPRGSNSMLLSTRNDARNDEANEVRCSCGHSALQLTVKKAGVNFGRKFYKCGNMNACNFFLWATDSTDQAQVNDFPVTNGNTAIGNAAISCKCGEPAKLLTVHKEGPNTGRQFFTCSKPRDQSCNFFQWADTANVQQQSEDHFVPLQRNGSVNEVSNKRPRLATTDTNRKIRRCGLCRQEGHTKRNCPNK